MSNIAVPDPRLWTSSKRGQATHRILSDSMGARFIVPEEYVGTRLLKTVVPLLGRVRIQLATKLLPPSFCIPTALTKSLVDELSVEHPVVVGRIGAPGPYSKDLLMIFDRNETPKVALKVGTSIHGAELVRNEVCNIERLLKNPGMDKFLPRVVFSRPLAGGYVMAEQFAQGDSGKKEITSEYLHFLKALQSEPCNPVGSVLCRCEAIAMDLWEVLESRWKHRIDRCLTALKQLPDGLPMVFAHRDFTCWNVVNSEGGMTVLDWEYAAEGYTPMHDLFHYLLFRRSLSRDLSAILVRKTIQDGKSAAGKAGFKLITESAPLQLLSYLLDLCLLHLKSHEGKASSRVAERYGDVIDAFPDWSF